LLKMVSGLVNNNNPDHNCFFSNTHTCALRSLVFWVKNYPSI